MNHCEWPACQHVQPSHEGGEGECRVPGCNCREYRGRFWATRREVTLRVSWADIEFAQSLINMAGDGGQGPYEWESEPARALMRRLVDALNHAIEHEMIGDNG